MKPKNFDKTCRVCLDVSEFVTPLFGTVFKSDLPDKIAYCTGLKIEKGDGNPSHICQCCLDNLHISYIFKKTCVKNNNFFIKHIYGIKNATVKVERIIIDNKHKNIDEAKEINAKFDCDIKNDVTGVKTEIEFEVYDGAIEKLDEEDFHTYDGDSLNITDNDKEDKNYNKLPNNDDNQNNDIAEVDDDDFYWHDDKVQMGMVKPAKPVKTKVENKNKNQKSIKKRPKRTKIMQNKENERNKRKRERERGTRMKWQRVDEYGNPKKFKEQVLKERAEARKQELARLRASKPPPAPKPKTNKVRILPDGVLPKPKKKRIKNKPPNIRCCLVCDIVFPTREERDAHVHEVHGGFTTTIICEVCGKLFASLGSFGYHYRSHYPPQYSCRHPGCTFKAYVSTMLRNHMILHEGGEEALYRYPCEQCGAKYKTASARTSHVQRAHCPRVRQYACAYCDKAFYVKAKLRLHEMTHTDQRPHACDICGAGFIRRDQLRHHAQNHHGVIMPPAELGRNKKNRVVDIYKLKDAGKMITEQKCDSVGGANEEVSRSSDNKGEKSDILGNKSDFDNMDGNNSGEGKNSEKLGKNSENIGRNSEKMGRKSENVGKNIEKVGDESEIDKQVTEINDITQEGGYEVTIGDEVYESDVIVEYIDDVVVMDMPKL